MPMKPDQAKPRDRAIERFLPEALQSAAGRVQGGAESACPDAELLAAYVGQGLAGDERDHLEDHFAACERCQKILAVLAAGDEVPLAEPETAGLGEAAVAAAPATPQSAARPSPSPQRWLWWLTPAFGAVAAALLWMVLRPASPGETAPVQTAADYSRPAEQETRSLIAPAAPSPAAEAPPADALGRQRQSLDSNLTARALPDAQAKQAAAEAEAVALPRAASAESAPAAPAARSAVAVTQAAPLAGVVTQGV
ncbi:MAG TPA: zf-HC2 domain-containing protein, partial [Candidatus Acidoferrales bacterium]